MSDGTGRLRLYNTLTRTKEDFEPLDRADVRMYVCGPTVYDYAHIGNARPAIVFDVLYRLLRHLYGADHVTYVRNITDVDDKINARALRDFGGEIAAGRLSLNEAIRKVTEPTYEQYQKDVTALGCLPPTHQPRATEFVLPRDDGKADMVTLIQSLIDRGHAYAANGEILFDVASMPDYGKLSRRNLDEQQAGARVAVDAHKKNPADFVLWKESSADEPGWEASFTVGGKALAIRGRPGWHIECSAMSEAYLGREFDIHGGGLDLIFPHHENEIAQSRCAHGTPTMAKVWMHNGFLQVEGRKMSKSEGNFVTIHELLETEKFGGRKWPGEVLRLAMLMTHYREPIDFSVRRLEEAIGLLDRWERRGRSNPVQASDLDETFVNSLADDLATPNAIARISELMARDATIPDGIAAMRHLGVDAMRSFPTGAEVRVPTLVVEVGGSPTSVQLEDKVAERLAFIREKNWGEADRIRDELLAQGIQLKDGKDPQTGERVTTWEVKR
jgi:cysteinyl-tRNA synthetase